MVAEKTDQNADFVSPLAAIELNEFRLVEGTCKPILTAGFFTISLSCIAISIVLRPYPSIVDSFLAGVAGAFCSTIGLTIPLFLGWGFSIFLGMRLNSILGKPLNPSGVAALSAGFGFAVAHTMSAAGLVFDLHVVPFGLAVFAIVAVLGSLLFQTVARVHVKREVTRHNLRAGRKPYRESPCHVRFQIWQMMVLIAAVSLFLGLAIRVADGSFVLLVTLWSVLTATAFYPATVIAPWVDQKLGCVTLKPWEEYRQHDWQADLEKQIATLAQTDDALPSNAMSKEPYVEDRVRDPLPNYRNAARFTSFDAMSSATKWISFSGGAFGLLCVIFLETSKAFFQGSTDVAGLFMALPCILGGLLFAAFAAAIATTFLGVINFLTGEQLSNGTLAAIAGGVVGSLGAWMLLCGLEVVHFIPWNGAVDFSAEDNRFPLAILLLASLMGQTFGRLGVKRCGRQCGLSFEKYQSEATGRFFSRYSLFVLILSVCAWVFVYGHNASGHKMAMEGHLGTVVLGAIACTLTVWPFANLLARYANAAPKSPIRSHFLFSVLRQSQA